jgi:hypothetical protein
VDRGPAVDMTASSSRPARRLCPLGSCARARHLRGRYPASTSTAVARQPSLMLVLCRGDESLLGGRASAFVSAVAGARRRSVGARCSGFCGALLAREADADVGLSRRAWNQAWERDADAGEDRVVRRCASAALEQAPRPQRAHGKSQCSLGRGAELRLRMCPSSRRAIAANKGVGLAR